MNFNWNLNQNNNPLYTAPNTGYQQYPINTQYREPINFLSNVQEFDPSVGLDGMTSNQMNLQTPVRNEPTISNTNRPQNNVQNNAQNKGNFWGVSSGLYGSGMLGTGFNELYSTPYYLHNLGRNIVGGSGFNKGLGIVGSGIGSILAGGRDVLGGMGAGNIQNFLQKEYQNRQTKNLRSNQSGYETARGQEQVGMQGGLKKGGEIKYQEGGETQQQPNPQEIVMAYAQKMGYNEEQMGQLMQGLSQLPQEEMSIALEEMMMALQEQMQEGGLFINTDGKEYIYPKKDNTRVKVVSVPDRLRNKSLTTEDLEALSHQKTGMGRFGPTSYVKTADGTLNRTAVLTPQEQKDLYEYMDSRGLSETIYQALPNFGRIFGEGYSAADLPSTSKLKKRFSKGGEIIEMQEGGEMMQQPQGGEEQMMMEIMNMVGQALQSGANPEQILQQLINEGIPEETAVQIIQQVMAQMQGGMEEQGQMGEALEAQPMEGQPMMKKGGKKKGLIMLY